MNKKLILKHILSGTMILFLVMPITILAEEGQGGGAGAEGEGPGPVTFDIKIENPFKGGDNLYEFIKTIINSILLQIGAILAVVMTIYAGFLYVTAQGDTAKIKKAHDALLYTIIGAAILLGAWVIAEAI